MEDVVSSSGSVSDHILYDSFGNITTETNATAGDRFKFAGMEWDSTTGLYYDRAQYMIQHGEVCESGSQGVCGGGYESVQICR